MKAFETRQRPPTRPWRCATALVFFVLMLLVTLFLFLPAVQPQDSFFNNALAKALSSFAKSPQPTLSRNARNIIYWTPHKTGSSSVRRWLLTIATKANLTQYRTKCFQYAKIEGWASKVGDKECGLFQTHLRTSDVRTRPHEAEKGTVITTSRDVYSQLISYYFHTFERNLTADIPLMRDDILSYPAKLWFYVWYDYDPCQHMRYYDGMEGCNLEEVEARAKAIASRIDCVIDSEDFQPDLDAICRVMQIENCPKLPSRNVRSGFGDEYKELMEIDHIRDSVQRVVRVTQVLRDELLKRRCRLMRHGAGIAEATLGDMPPAKWPTPGYCKSKR